MRLIRIAVASVDPTVGAVRSNVDRMLVAGIAVAPPGRGQAPPLHCCLE